MGAITRPKAVFCLVGICCLKKQHLINNAPCCEVLVLTLCFANRTFPEATMSDEIKCPHCGSDFDVEQALTGKLEARFKAQYEQKVAEQAEKFQSERQKLQTEQEAFAKKKERENELFKEALQRQIVKEKERIAAQTHENFEQRLKALQEENNLKKEENRQLRQQELDLLKRETQLKEQAEELELRIQKQLLEQQQEIETKARAKEREAMALKEKEYQKQLEDQKKLIDEMKRKSEQGSMQMQGEVQELALEELLQKAYPHDRIEEVPKGVRGADSIQTVINPQQQECGFIVYESKRTKHFANDWIEKLKQDQIQCKADIAVIVTEALPSDMERFGERNGVWICGFHEVASLSFVLREMLIKINSMRAAETNKGDKMELLYHYLTGNEFRQNINRIVENYMAMKDQLNAEKRAINRLWATREKQINVVETNLTALFGSIQGIAGSAIATPSLLELPGMEDEEGLF